MKSKTGQPQSQKKIVPAGKAASHRWTEAEHKTQAARPVGSGAGPRRGDRRAMNKVYTRNTKHSARGNTPRAKGSTRKG